MLTVKCQGCGAVYKLAEDLYSRKAAGFGVVVTCRRCKTEIHVEAPSGASSHTTNDSAETQTAPAADAPMPETYDGEVIAALATTKNATLQETPKDAAPDETPTPALTAALVAKVAAPLVVRATSKATARWPDVVAPTPIAPDASPLAAAQPTPRDESPAPARVAPTGKFPRPPIPKVVARKDPVAGPFVALSPGLLNAPRPEPIPDSEAPVDSSDFIDESRRGVSPKAPPVRRPPTPDKPPPVRREAALPLKLKEPPKPPKQKPRAPVPSDDVSDDLLSADVSFEKAQLSDAEAPRLVAPDSSALAAPPPESVRPRESPKAAPTSPSPVASDAEPRRSGKSSRVIPIVLLALGGTGAFVFAFRSQLPGNEAAPAPEKRAVNDTPAAQPLIPPPPPTPERETAAAEPVAPPASAVPASTATPRSARTGEAVSKTASPPSTAAATPAPAITAPAPGTPEPSDAPRAKAEGPFDADAARAALAGAVAQASSCRKPGDPSGVAAVTITFSPSGRVTSATIAGPPFAGTPTGGCIAATLRRARVPAFEGDMVTVRKTVEIQ